LAQQAPLGSWDGPNTEQEGTRSGKLSGSSAANQASPQSPQQIGNSVDTLEEATKLMNNKEFEKAKILLLKHKEELGHIPQYHVRLLECYTHEWDMEGAWQVYEDMKEVVAGVQHYKILTRAYLKAAKFKKMTVEKAKQGIERLKQEIEKQGDPQPIEIFDAMLSLSPFKKAISILDHAINLNSQQYSISSFVVIIEKFLQQGDISGALKWIENIKSEGVKENGALYYPLFKFYAAKGKPSKITKLWEKLEENSVDFSKYSKKDLINEATFNQELDAAIEWLKDSATKSDRKTSLTKGEQQIMKLIEKAKKMGLNVQRICEKVVMECPKQDAYIIMQMYKSAPKSKKVINAQKGLLQALYESTQDQKYLSALQNLK